MITARHPLAAEAGVGVLQAGGNAVDAAVAAAFANSVLQPFANTIGGGGMAVIRLTDGATAAVDYRYEAPHEASSSMFTLDSTPSFELFGWTGVANRANQVGPAAVAIPGSVAGLVSLSHRFGRLPLADVIAPAIRLCSNGFEVDWYGSMMQAAYVEDLMAFPRTASTFLRDARFPYRPPIEGPGDVHQQPSLARTLEHIAAEGADSFYRGAAAQEFVAAMSRGGIIGIDDLDGYRPRETEPTELDYRGWRILAPPTMAIIVQTLRMFALLDLGELEPGDVSRLHLMAEVLRLARRNQADHYGDFALTDSPWDVMGSSHHASQLVSIIDCTHRIEPPTWPTVPRPEHTVHISAADSEGNFIALTETILGNFGSFVTTSTGVLLNNGMMGFDPVPGRANSIRPMKRPVTNMSPVVVLHPDGQPFATLGASGGARIPGAVAQILSLLLDNGLDIQSAVSYPRIDVEGETLLIDARFGTERARALEGLGHHVALVNEDLSTLRFANPSGIVRATPEGGFLGATNPLQMTHAVGC
jgi:gamma-glutamyltranspeptidase/glutathione hydrolase